MGIMQGMENYWNISRAAEETGFSVPTLRFYEQKGLITSVPRDGSGNRFYGEREQARLNSIRCLRAAGLSLADMKRYFSLADEGSEETLRVRREILQRTQENLLAQRDELERCLCFLSAKIAYYDAAIDAAEHGREAPVFDPTRLKTCFPGRKSKGRKGSQGKRV